MDSLSDPAREFNAEPRQDRDRRGVAGKRQRHPYYGLHTSTVSVSDKAEGIISTQFLKDLSDPAWKEDKGAAEYLAWMAKNLPGEDPANDNFQIGFSEGLTLVHVLEKCGDTLTRANVMQQAADIRNLPLPMLLPGIVLNTSATNFHPIRKKQLIRFHNGAWERIGEPISY